MTVFALRTAWPLAEGKQTNKKPTVVVNLVGQKTSCPLDGELKQRLLSIFYLSMQPGQHRAKL